MGWTYADIRYKTRQVTGRLSSDEISDQRILWYINNYYVYKFPSEVKLDQKFTYYSFNTEANVQTYTGPQTTFTNLVPPLYVNGRKVWWYQDPSVFYASFPKQYNTNTIATGDGSETNFTYTLSFTPILAGSVIVTDNTLTYTDNGDGTLSGSAGTIDYETGDIDVTFATAPANGDDIVVRGLPYFTGIPQAVLYYDNTLTMYPIPDTVYPCELQAFSVTTPFSDATDTPDLQEWGPAIAYGTALDILADYAEMDRYAEVQVMYQKEIDYILTRTAVNMNNVGPIRGW